MNICKDYNIFQICKYVNKYIYTQIHVFTFFLLNVKSC